ncbi:AAA family ATPase [Chelatococcus sp. SYSU_G07232]|uniref:AAA family ATPase n=1 Tax=Chelatococcus albus TaxID=3047466 RepID=A0ABT7ABE3_9HYPH|nr:AAA family ATPase [Chelatococcus sp. SYSU_G07232]MDJ1156687.1 AAA family ATPase [Chelatococcus sp. SYSU_G07232]
MQDRHVVSDQGEVLAFLGDPRSHGLTEPVRRIDTHGAVVFLAGENAYKVKRAVRYPFMDFSTLERRRAACEAEIAVNRPNAPHIYLGAVPITRTDSGLAIAAGPGPVIEWAVHMHRFDETKTLDRLAEAGGLSASLLDDLVAVVLAAHRRAPLRAGEGAVASLERYIAQNEEAFAETPALFAPERAEALTRAARGTFARVRPLLLARGEAGHVRRCHGDLHLRNVVLVDGRPTLFDAIEFDDAIATGDLLYDLAFLLMDLWERGLAVEANVVLNRYLFRSGEEAHLEGLAALPLFLSIRAGIRAKVVAAALPHLPPEEQATGTRDAQRYFRLAEECLASVPPLLVAVGGLSGTGKSTLAAGLAPRVGRLPGAVHLRSDSERKAMFSVAETEPLPEEAYALTITAEVYARLRRKAALALAAGQGVVVDAVHARADERAAIEEVARRAGAGFHGLWLEAPLPALVARIEGRARDASDATPAVVSRQAARDIGPMRWRVVDARGDAETVLSAALDALRLT